MPSTIGKYELLRIKQANHLEGEFLRNKRKIGFFLNKMHHYSQNFCQ